jgi:hypothetical protein
VHALLAPLNTSFDGKIITPDLRRTKALLAEDASRSAEQARQ